MNLEEAFFRLSVALACGMLIGVERQWRQKMAGLRTNVLVAFGSASFALFAQMAVTGGDVVRMGGQIVTGIGFLGAGVIMHQGVSVHGLNTAATLWCSAAVGMFAGGGLLTESALIALFITFINMATRPFAALINRHVMSPAEIEVHYLVKVCAETAEQARLRAALLAEFEKAGLGLQQLKSTNIENDAVEIAALLVAPRRNDQALERIIGQFGLEPAVSVAKWQAQPQSASGE